MNSLESGDYRLAIFGIGVGKRGGHNLGEVLKILDEKTVMADLGLPQEEATDIAAYLYTLK